MGPSGSGKSTLGKLLLGLYIPTGGTIFYDDVPLHHLNYQEVRQQFGVVLQEASLFSGTILSNITLNNPTIDREQVIEAAKIAAIHDDIMNMPMEYDTLVAEGGSALSGGQRQRLAIARAIAHKPALLLLDEATSHLDVATEHHVAQHLQDLACTQIIIAHRLSTIRDADVILMLYDGMIVEQGSHEQLLQLNGYYARLMQHQMKHATADLFEGLDARNVWEHVTTRLESIQRPVPESEKDFAELPTRTLAAITSHYNASNQEIESLETSLSIPIQLPVRGQLHFIKKPGQLQFIKKPGQLSLITLKQGSKTRKFK